MAGVAHIEIKETQSQLHSLMSKQKDVVAFKKIQALYLFKIGQVETVKDLANSIGVHRVTIQKWFKKYRDQGIKGLLEVGERTGRPTVVSEYVISELKARLSDPSQKFKSYEEIHHWLEEKYGVHADYKTVYSLVKYKLKTDIKTGLPTYSKKSA